MSAGSHSGGGKSAPPPTDSQNSGELPSIEELLHSAPARKAKKGKPEPVPAVLLVCSLHENERPLPGAAGVLDWRLRGLLSRFVLAGGITGTRDEMTYVPVQHHGQIRHLLLVGLGDRAAVLDGRSSGAVLRRLSETIGKLGFSRVAISQSSFPFVSAPQFEKAFDNIHVEMVR